MSEDNNSLENKLDKKRRILKNIESTDNICRIFKGKDDERSENGGLTNAQIYDMLKENEPTSDPNVYNSDFQYAI